jgi:hypothetical protein
MKRPDSTAAPALLIALALAGCERQPAQPEARAPMNAQAADDALDRAMNATDGAPPANAPPASALPANQAGLLVPPAPGEPGGLPDDRAPLDEKAARDPTSVPASGATLERWGIALAQGRYGDAYRLWRERGRKSGMSEADFAQAYRRYSEIHVLVGRPVADGPQTVRVPVQLYGRLRATGRPFNLLGTMTLARNPAGQHGAPGEMPWLITASDLKPRGTVRIEPLQAAQAHATRIPAAFQGRWAGSQARCDRPGDDTRLTVNPASLIYYESLGQVRAVERIAPRQIRVAAQYSGEGETWSRTTRLRLSENGAALTVDGMTRRRCAS